MGIIKWYSRCAKLYFGLSCVLGIVCCAWTLDHDDYVQGNPIWAFGMIGTVFTSLLIFAVVHQACRQKKTVQGVSAGTTCWTCCGSDTNGKGYRLAHLAASFISIFSVCVASGNIINWYDNRSTASAVLMVLSACIITVQWLFLVFCVPCNGILLCFPSSNDALLQQYVEYGDYMASKAS